MQLRALWSFFRGMRDEDILVESRRETFYKLFNKISTLGDLN